MKTLRILSICIICVLLLLLASCDVANETSETPHTAESTPIQTTPISIETTYPPATVPSYVPTNTKETSAMPILPISDHMDDFESFGRFPVDPITTTLYREKSKVYPGHLRGSGMVRVIVEGVNPDYVMEQFTVYDVRILECYGFDADADTERIYQMAYRGTPRHPLHDRPALQIGKEYLRPGTVDPSKQLMQASVVLPIEYQNGAVYVYGYGVDLSELSCAEVITDDAENQIFKAHIHRKYIDYAKANGIRLPTFDYKCEINAFLREIGVIMP